MVPAPFGCVPSSLMYDRNLKEVLNVHMKQKDMLFKAKMEDINKLK